jgi:hypothetical protein
MISIGRFGVVVVTIVCVWSGVATAVSPILEFDFTNGSSANTGSGSQTASAVSPGVVVASGGLDGTGSYQNHDTPNDGVNTQTQLGRFSGLGLDDTLRSITVTMWLKADVPFINGPNSNVQLFNTAGFYMASRNVPPGSGQFGVSTGNSTQPVILFDKTVASTPDFGAGDVGQWRFVALTLDMVYDSNQLTTFSTVKLYRGSLTDPVALWGTGTRSQDGDRTTEIDNAFAVGNNRNGSDFSTQQQFLGEIDSVRFYGSGNSGEAALSQNDLEQIRLVAIPEPGTALLVAIGMAALGLPLRHLRRR